MDTAGRRAYRPGRGGECVDVAGGRGRGVPGGVGRGVAGPPAQVLTVRPHPANLPLRYGVVTVTLRGFGAGPLLAPRGAAGMLNGLPAAPFIMCLWGTAPGWTGPGRR
jgi:hypothetical protein